MSVSVLQMIIYKLLIVVYDAYVADGVGAEMRADQQRLGIGVGYDADSRGAGHLIKYMFKLGSKRCVLDIVDLTLQPDLGIVGGKSASSCAEMRVIVNAEEHIHHAIFFRSNAEKSSHFIYLRFN